MIILLFLFIILVALTVRKSHMGLGWYFVIRLVIPPSARLIGLSFNTICLATFGARGDRYIDSLSLIVNNATTSSNYISHQCLPRYTAWCEQATRSPRTFTSHWRSMFHRPKGYERLIPL